MFGFFKKEKVGPHLDDSCVICHNNLVSSPENFQPGDRVEWHKHIVLQKLDGRNRSWARICWSCFSKLVAIETTETSRLAWLTEYQNSDSALYHSKTEIIDILKAIGQNKKP